MPHNLARWDRVVRVVAGAAIVATVFVGPKSVLGLLGLVFVVTGAAGYCPVYRALGITSL